MLIFRKGTAWYLMFRVSGSAIPKASIAGLCSAIVTLLIEFLVPHEYMDRLLQHPYPFQPFAYVAAFALVFRTNVAYNRYWECTTAITMFASKFGDALVEAITFDELINTNKRPKGEEGVLWLEVRRRFQSLMVRRFSLLHALVLQYMRRDDDLANLIHSSGRDPAVSLGLGAFGGMHQPQSRSDPKWQQLEVLGGIVPSEFHNVRNSFDRVSFVYAQILHLSNQRRADGGLGADAPVLSRYYQLLSDAMLGFRQARKIEDIPFPWPYTQAISAMLFFFMLIFPVVLSHFANCGADRTCDEPTWWLGPFLAFITVTSYVTLQQVARALEDPFVHPPNDLPANALQAAFNGRLLTTWDVIRKPADSLIGMPPPPGSPGSTTSPGGNGLGLGVTADDDDDKYWGEWAELEPEDVREASVALLKEWRAHRDAAKVYEGKGHVSTPRLVQQSRRAAPHPLMRSMTSPSLAISSTASPSGHRQSGTLELLPGSEPRSNEPI